jgi:hypothetical protein
VLSPFTKSSRSPQSTPSTTATRPLVTRHLLLLQEHEASWISRSALAGDRDIWREQQGPDIEATTADITADAAKMAEVAPAFESTFSPLIAAADLFERAPRGRLKRADSLTVLLGFPYVRHIILPWQSGLAKTEHWQEYAGAMFDEQYGGGSHAWKTAVDPAPYGLDRLAAATDTALIQGLQSLAQVHQLRLISCVSLLTAAVQRYWKILEEDCVLSLPQPAAIECLFRKQGTWQGVCGLQTLPDAVLVDSVAVAAALAHATIASPLLVVTTSPSRLHNAQESGLIIRWLGAAHPWLKEVVQ